MKYLLVLLLIIPSLCSVAQQTTYEEWKQQAKNEITMLPEYGNVQKSKEQVDADQQFIKTCLEQDGTARKASDHLVSLGFNYLYKGDIKTAMYRFNQAWLLDHTNENAYWGFGAIYFGFYDKKNTFKQYDKGLILNPKSSNILTDKASVYMMIFQREGDAGNLKKAIQFFIESYNIDNKNQNTLFKLSVSYFLSDDCVNARKFYEECKKLGGLPITQGYTDALNQKCKN